VSTDESLTRAEELLKRVEDVRAELEKISTSDEGSPDRAIELLGQLSELAKAVEEELTRAQREADAQS
jgi:hypothetical protein